MSKADENTNSTVIDKKAEAATQVVNNVDGHGAKAGTKPERPCPVIVSGSLEKAKVILAAAANAEPLATKDMTDLCGKFGANLVGLEYRLKTEDSLARKIETDPYKPNRDALRYTMVFDDQTIAEGSMAVMKEMQKKGYIPIIVKNTFKKGCSYKGINTAFIAPNGSIMELQFHTTKSFETKQITHKLYEEERLLKPGTPEAIKLKEEQAVMSDSIPIPPGIEKVK